MTSTIDQTNQETEANGSNKPDWRLVQNKAYFAGENGRQVKKQKTVQITAGWNQTSKDGMDYISLAVSVMDISPDIDGKIDLVLFPANQPEEGTA